MGIGQCDAHPAGIAVTRSIFVIAFVSSCCYNLTSIIGDAFRVIAAIKYEPRYYHRQIGLSH